MIRKYVVCNKHKYKSTIIRLWFVVLFKHHICLYVFDIFNSVIFIWCMEYATNEQR